MTKIEKFGLMLFIIGAIGYASNQLEPWLIVIVVGSALFIFGAKEYSA